MAAYVSNIVIDVGADFNQTFNLEGSNNAPLNLTGYSGASFLKKSPASLECKLFKIIGLPGINNNIVIGKVIGIHIDDKMIKNGIFDILAYKPIARMGYKDYTAVDNKFVLERPE